MKKRFALTGLLGGLLIAGMVFIACPMDSGGGGGGGTGPDDLPDLPSGTEYVANQAEALTLLSVLRPAFVSVQNDVENIVEDAMYDAMSTGKDSWNISDTSISGLKITSKGSYTGESKPANFGEKDWVPAVGNYMKESFNSEIAVDFTGDKTDSGVTVYEKSGVRVKESETMKVEIKALTGTYSGTINYSESEEDSYTYTLTASGSGKGGKIILDIGRKASVNKDIVASMEEEPDFPDAVPAYSGSLTVYGADNEAVYTLPVTDSTTFYQARGFFE